MKVSEITEILGSWMPTSLAENNDNVGLIVGDRNSEVDNIMITLDSTVDVIEEAVKNNCNLIISYHPIIFNSIKKITQDSGYVQESIIKAIKNNISIYAIHTSLDNHHEGISYHLSKKLGLKNLSTLIPNESINKEIEHGMGIIGELDSAVDENVFFELIKEKLKLKYLRHSQKLNRKIMKVSIVAGSGSFAINNSLESGVDAFITSDLKYHNFFEANNNLVLIDIGHYESERHIKLLIKEFLKEKLPNFTILLSEQNINPVKYY